MQTEQELVSTLQQIDHALAQVHGADQGHGNLAAAAGFNPCQEYNKIRGILDAVIRLAESLPFGVGKRIAAVLKTLKAILDQLCPHR